MTTGRFRVVPGDLAVHAEHVAALDQVIGEARSAAAPLSPDSYGVVGKAFAFPAILATDEGIAALDLLRNDLTTTAAALRESAAGYLAADRSSATRIGEAR
jgi:hypothetical protein